ncbi:hypothetical protein TWF281_003060 [Arthrobotrys megalospora]
MAEARAALPEWYDDAEAPNSPPSSSFSHLHAKEPCLLDTIALGACASCTRSASTALNKAVQIDVTTADTRSQESQHMMFSPRCSMDSVERPCATKLHLSESWTGCWSGEARAKCAVSCRVQKSYMHLTGAVPILTPKPTRSQNPHGWKSLEEPNCFAKTLTDSH